MIVPILVTLGSAVLVGGALRVIFGGSTGDKADPASPPVGKDPPPAVGVGGPALSGASADDQAGNTTSSGPRRDKVGTGGSASGNPKGNKPKGGK